MPHGLNIFDAGKVNGVSNFTCKTGESDGSDGTLTGVIGKGTSVGIDEKHVTCIENSA